MIQKNDEPKFFKEASFIWLEKRFETVDFVFYISTFRPLVYRIARTGNFERLLNLARLNKFLLILQTTLIRNSLNLNFENMKSRINSGNELENRL